MSYWCLTRWSFFKGAHGVENLLKYELSPLPMSLFDVGGMSKTQRSTLYKEFPLTMANIWMSKVVLLSPVGVFSSTASSDLWGIETINCTKRSERKSRGSTKTSADFLFSDDMMATVLQEPFLANEKNKVRPRYFYSHSLLEFAR